MRSRAATISGVCPVEKMDRRDLIQAILGTECDFPNDLSREYLQSLSLEKLQHICRALKVHRKGVSQARDGEPDGR